MTGEAIRRRLNTAGTAESKDSGIDLRSRARLRRTLPKMGIAEENEEDSRKWDADTILWTITFAMTVWFFNLPYSIWFNNDINWFFMYISIVSVSLFLLLGLFLLVTYRGQTAWHWKSPRLFRAAWMFFLIAVASFCTATWLTFGWWSVYICGVTFMFLVTIAPLF